MSSASVQQAPGINRTDLQEHDLSVPGHMVIQNRVELSPEAPYVWHKHGQGDHLRPRRNAGIRHRGPDATDVQRRRGPDGPAAETPHAVRSVGAGSGTELATYIVEKGKPFLEVLEVAE